MLSIFRLKLAQKLSIVSLTSKIRYAYKKNMYLISETPADAPVLTAVAPVLTAAVDGGGIGRSGESPENNSRLAPNPLGSEGPIELCGGSSRT